MQKTLYLSHFFTFKQFVFFVLLSITALSFGMEPKQESANKIGDVIYQTRVEREAELIDMKLVDIMLEHQCPKRLSLVATLMADYRKNHNLIPPTLLFHGDEDIEKSTLARGIAAKAKIACVFIDCLELDAKSTSLNLRKRVEEAMNSTNPYVIVLDKVGALLGRPNDDYRSDGDASGSFSLLVDELQKKNPYACIIGTTNSISTFSRSAQNQFDKHIEISYPDVTGYEKIIRYYVDQSNFGCDEKIITALAESIRGQTGRTIKRTIREAGLFAYERLNDMGSIKLEHEDIFSALKSAEQETAAKEYAAYQLRIEREAKAMEKEMALVDIILNYHSPQALKHVIENMKDCHKKYDRIPKAILFHGKPGTGKSTLARGIAVKAKMACVVIDCPALGDSFQNSASNRLREQLKGVLKTNYPCLIVLDEVGSVLERDKESSRGNTDFPYTFLTFFDELKQHKPYVFIIGTTNKYDTFSDATKSRFRKTMEIGATSKEGCPHAIRYHINNLNVSYEEKLISAMASRLYTLEGRDIEGLIQDTVNNAESRLKKADGDITITYEDFARALKDSNMPSPFYANFNSLLSTLKPYVVPNIIPVLSLLFNMYTFHTQSQVQQEQSDFNKDMANQQLALAQQGLALNTQSHELAKQNTQIAADSFVSQVVATRGCEHTLRFIPENIQKMSAEFIKQLQKHRYIED